MIAKHRRAEQTKLYLIEVGISMKDAGFHYLMNSILKVAEDPSLIDSIMKGLYPAIAEIYHLSPSAIEAGMRRSIERAWNRSPEKMTRAMEEVFEVRIRKKPSNTEFISTIAHHLMLSEQIEEAALRRHAARAAVRYHGTQLSFEDLIPEPEGRWLGEKAGSPLARRKDRRLYLPGTDTRSRRLEFPDLVRTADSASLAASGKVDF